MSSWESKVGIVILNYNGANLTIENVNRLRSYSKEIYIIVVDNCSTDESGKKLLSMFENDSNTRVVLNDKNTGYAAGNNVGLKYIEKNLPNVDTVCIMNPDIVLESLETLEHMYCKLWKYNDLAIVSAQTIYNGQLRYPNDFGWKHLTPKYMMFGGTLLGKILKPNIRYEKLLVDKNNVAYVDIVQGCFFMAKKKAFAEVGWFDEGTFLYEEEAILAKKMRYKGYKLGILIDEFIYHNHHEKDKSLIKKKNKLFDMRCFYNSRKYYIKNYSDKSKIFIKFACIFLNFDFFLKRLIKRLF